MSNIDESKDFSFPFPPYEIQRQFMLGLFSSLEEKKLGIFESPTGTGKSLSLICGALTWLEEHMVQYKEQLQILAEEKIEEDDIEDWFNSATKRIDKENDQRRAKKEIEKIGKREKRLKNLHLKISEAKRRYNDGKRFEDNLKEPDDNQQEKLSNESDLPQYDEEFLLDDYCSEGEETTEESDSDEEDEGCLKIFYCSRTHSQLSQFVREIQKTRFKDDARVTSLASRQNLCINDSVSKLPSLSMINERCIELQSADKGVSTKLGEERVMKKKKTNAYCPYKRQNNIQNLSDQVLLEVQNLDQFLSYGRKLKACPYYASRKSIRDAQLVVLPYNCLLHKSTREACKINLKNNVVIVDEAHNLLETIANIHSTVISYTQICGALLQLSEYLRRYEKRLSPKNLLYMKQILFLVKAYKKLLSSETSGKPIGSTQGTNVSKLWKIDEFLFQTFTDNLNLFKILQYIEKSKIAHKLHGFKKVVEGEVTINSKESKPTEKVSASLFLAKIVSQSNQKKKGKEPLQQANPCPPPSEEGNKQEEEVWISGSPLLGIAEFLQALTCGNSDGRIVVNVAKDPKKSFIKYLLLNPASQFHDIVRDCRSVIVAGGTMSPIEEFKQQLFLSSGADPERIVEFSFSHVVPEENVLPLVLCSGPGSVSLDFTYKNRGDTKMLDELGRTLINFCNIIPGGVVCFFPSYDMEESIYQRFRLTNVLTKLSAKKKVFREPKKANLLDKILYDYSQAVHKGDPNGVKGAILFCVVGGKMSEGINFSDDLGRCVIMVGMPYPNSSSPELKEKMAYLDAHFPKNSNGKSAGASYNESLCFKAVNQSIGRSIRHRNDYACILLLDHRYSSEPSLGKLPSWIRSRTKVCSQFGQSFALVRKFFAEKKVKV